MNNKAHIRITLSLRNPSVKQFIQKLEEALARLLHPKQHRRIATESPFAVFYRWNVAALIDLRKAAEGTVEKRAFQDPANGNQLLAGINHELIRTLHQEAAPKGKRNK